MKFLIPLFFFLFFPNATDLTTIRKMYSILNKTELNANDFAEKLAAVTKSDNKTLYAYKGASVVILAKYKKLNSDKSKIFKEGATMIEYAVSNEPKNIEIRLIRLSIQEKAPKILNYSANKSEDKKFLLDHYNEESGSFRTYITNFMLQSKSFSDAEKQLIK